MVTSDQIVGRPRTECAVASILPEPATAPVNWYTSVIVHIQRLKTYRHRTYRNASPLSMIYFSVTASPAEDESPFRGQGKPTAALRRKRVNWSNDDALCHLVRRHTEPDDDELGRGRLLTALNQLSLQPKQVCRCLGNLGASEFYFHGNPSSITLVNHGIDFEIVGVMIMGYRRVICGGIDLEIVQNKGFEKQPQCPRVGYQ